MPLSVSDPVGYFPFLCELTPLAPFDSTRVTFLGMFVVRLASPSLGNSEYAAIPSSPPSPSPYLSPMLGLRAAKPGPVSRSAERFAANPGGGERARLYAVLTVLSLGRNRTENAALHRREEGSGVWGARHCITYEDCVEA